nr:increased DNA methylation 1 isoform X2 [Ipomoea batatas]
MCERRSAPFPIAGRAKIGGCNSDGLLGCLALPCGVYTFYFVAGSAARCVIEQCRAQCCSVWGIGEVDDREEREKPFGSPPRPSQPSHLRLVTPPHLPPHRLLKSVLFVFLTSRHNREVFTLHSQFPNSLCLYTLNLSLVLNIRCFLSPCCVGSATPPTVAPMKLDSDVALEDVPELADSEVQIRDVQEQESGVDNLADGVNEEINGTTSIGELSSVRFRDSKGIVVYRRSKELNKEAVKECS